MKRILLTFFCIAAWNSPAQTTNPAPAFDEVYKLLREHISGLSDDGLNRAAVEGLIKELSPRVSLTTNAPAAAVPPTNLLSQATIYDKNFVYFRISEVEGDLNEKIVQKFSELSGTNKMKGVVLDLRFARGSDYSAAAKTADAFLNSEQPLLDWGSGSVNSTKKTNAISVPVAVLVNRQTSGAAEALAAVLREMKVALLIGATTAGEASIYKEFPLQNGQRLHIATAQLKIGKGVALSDALKPDIEVAVNSDDEKMYFDDPYKTLSKPIGDVQLSLSTNAPTFGDTNKTRARLNEAELVRRKREGLSEDEEFVDKPLARTDLEIKIIRDPALARAVDLLKALAVVQSQRPL